MRYLHTSATTSWLPFEGGPLAAGFSTNAQCQTQETSPGYLLEDTTPRTDCSGKCLQRISCREHTHTHTHTFVGHDLSLGTLWWTSPSISEGLHHSPRQEVYSNQFNRATGSQRLPVPELRSLSVLPDLPQAPQVEVPCTGETKLLFCSIGFLFHCPR